MGRLQGRLRQSVQHDGRGGEAEEDVSGEPATDTGAQRPVQAGPGQLESDSQQVLGLDQRGEDAACVRRRGEETTT